MNEMTLPYRHGIRNSSPCGLKPSMLHPVTEAPHDIESYEYGCILQDDTGAAHMFLPFLELFFSVCAFLDTFTIKVLLES